MLWTKDLFATYFRCAFCRRRYRAVLAYQHKDGRVACKDCAVLHTFERRLEIVMKRAFGGGRRRPPWSIDAGDAVELTLRPGADGRFQLDVQVVERGKEAQ
jgi:hypothetical protein